MVASDAPVLAYGLAHRDTAKSLRGRDTIAVKQPDGSLPTSRVAAENDEVTPPISAGPRRLISVVFA